jgi:hypothetical protein
LSLHPLLDLANDREVKQAKGFRAVAADQNGEKLEALYKQEADAAPDRRAKGKKFLGVNTGRIPRAPQAGKDDRHAAMALGGWAKAGGGPVSLSGDLELTIVDHLVPLRTAAPDKAKGDADPNKGVEDLDLLGQLSDGRLAVVRLKYLAPSATRGGAGDTPLRVLLSGLAQTAMVDANRASLGEEVEEATGQPISEEAPALLIVASARYWEICRKREAQKGAGWIREIERLTREVATQIGVEVFIHGLAFEEDPAWSYTEAGPELAGGPVISPAWEAGAGKLKPKPKSRSKKSDDVPALIEADPDRPVRAYSIFESFEPGDQITHPNLGTGVVQGIMGRGKISVLFADEMKLLVHERPSPTS